MRFTREQYDAAIQSLTDAREQLEPDGRLCTCCGDSGHQAFECGHNPLVAMSMCERIAKESQSLHDTLHWLSGFEMRMGSMVGPAKVIVPAAEVAKKGATQ